MIRNPFFYRAADVRIGSMADDRLFVDLFGTAALELLPKNITNLWELPVILSSAPGGGKSSLMRIFTTGALDHISKSAGVNKDKKTLSEKMEKLGALKDGKPFALGIWFRISDEYQAMQNCEADGKNGLFNALLNSRIILHMIKAVCERYDLNLFDHDDLKRISFALKQSAETYTISAWRQLDADDASKVFDRMAKLEVDICDMIDDPFWQGDRSGLSHGRLWSIDLLANLEIFVDQKPFIFRPLVMLDDVHELTKPQLKYLLNLLFSRQVAVPFWISMRKQAMGLNEIINEKINRGIEKERDYLIIDFEKNQKNFQERASEIANLRVNQASPDMVDAPDNFIHFLPGDRENDLSYKKNLNREVIEKIKARIEKAAYDGSPKFKRIIGEQIDESNIYESCLNLKKIEIQVQRNPQKSLLPPDTLYDDANKSKNSIEEAAELFLAKDYKLPYYCGFQKIISLSSFNINQFLKLGGSLFEEIMIMNRLKKTDKLCLSPLRQQAIIEKIARNFLNEISKTMPYGSQVFRLIDSIGKICKEETYKPTAPYAPGVTGVAITMSDYERLRNEAKKENEKSLFLYRVIESAVAHNILEPKPNCKEKGKIFLVLYLNRLLCVPYQLPLQKGRYIQKDSNILFDWVEYGYEKSKKKEEGNLW